MAANIESLTHGDSSGQSELRIVLLGSSEDDTNKVAKSFLNCKNLKGVHVGLCTLYESEQEGRRIIVVEAPGWDRHSVKPAPERIKADLERSVSLCPPGPHALLLLIPVRSLCEDPSSGEMDSALELMGSLSDRIWKHTIVLFDCDERVEESVVKENIYNASKILEKRGVQYFELQREKKQINELFRRIDKLVQENLGDVFNERIQQKPKESSGEIELRQRRGSLQKSPPNLKEGDSEEKKETVEAPKYTLSEDGAKIILDFKQFVVILMGIFGALLGSVAGAQNGVLGSFTGIVAGIIVGVLLASFIMYIYTHIYLRTYSKQPTPSTSTK